MRHRKANNHLKRKSSHRKSMLANMSCSLLIHKRIKTTLAKAKVLKQFIEPIITRSKKDSTHNRRICFRYLRHKDAVKELFSAISDKVLNRPGGYTRIIKLGNRLGDAADMCLIELVDFNDVYNVTERKKRRTRRSKSSDNLETQLTNNDKINSGIVDTSKVSDTLPDSDTSSSDTDTSSSDTDTSSSDTDTSSSGTDTSSSDTDTSSSDTDTSSSDTDTSSSDTDTSSSDTDTSSGEGESSDDDKV